ncbi:MAG: hypothetical protein QM783_07075 [Phycisphaerales bacterium]
MERLQSLRYQLGDLLQDKPWIKWAAPAIGVLVLLLIGRAVFFSTSTDPALNGDRMATQVQVKFEDTGETMKVPVGSVTSDLLTASGPSDGWRVTNPKSGKRSGMVTEKSEWSRIVKDVERLKLPQNAAP